MNEGNMRTGGGGEEWDIWGKEMGGGVRKSKETFVHLEH